MTLRVAFVCRPAFARRRLPPARVARRWRTDAHREREGRRLLLRARPLVRGWGLTPAPAPSSDWAYPVLPVGAQDGHRGQSHARARARDAASPGADDVCVRAAQNTVVVSEYTQMDRILRDERKYILEVCVRVCVFVCVRVAALAPPARAAAFARRRMLMGVARRVACVRADGQEDRKERVQRAAGSEVDPA